MVSRPIAFVLGAARRGRRKCCVQTQTGNNENFLQGGTQLRSRIVRKPPFEFGEDSLLVVPAHRNDEGVPEFGAVGLVERADACHLRAAKPVEAGAGLFVFRGIGHFAGTRFAVKPIGAADFRRLSPAIVPGPVAAAFYSSLDGHLDPVRVTERFLAAAKRHVAELRFPCHVTEIATRNGRVTGVSTPDGVVDVDHLVIAAGVDTPRLLRLLGEELTLTHAPGILAHSVPTRIVTRMVYDGPGGLEFKQMADGSIVGTDSEQVPSLPVHAQIREHPIDFPSDGLRSQHGERILQNLSAVMPAAKGVDLNRLTLGFRVLPTDGLPIVGGHCPKI